MARKLIAFGLFALTLLLYVPTCVYGSLNWYDPDFVTENAYVKQGLAAESVRWALTTN